MRIAALDDEIAQLEFFRQAMAAMGHECHGFTSGKALLRELRQETFDLLILDCNVPDMSSLAVVKVIRQELSGSLPVLFVSDPCVEANMIDGLGAEGDDFMVKPVRVGELEARVGALLRRTPPSRQTAQFTFGPYRFSPSTRTLDMNGQVFELKHREYELALYLFQNLGRLLSREQLLAVWRPTAEEPARLFDTHIARLRTKLGIRPANGFLLSTIHYGIGYRLEALDMALLSPQPDVTVIA